MSENKNIKWLKINNAHEYFKKLMPTKNTKEIDDYLEDHWIECDYVRKIISIELTTQHLKEKGDVTSSEIRELKNIWKEKIEEYQVKFGRSYEVYNQEVFSY